MARSKVEVQKNLFSLIDAHCAAAQDPIANAGSPRWIDTSSDPNVSFMTRAKLAESTSFSAARHLARYDLDGRSYFCTVGFDYISSAPAGLNIWPPSTSELVYIISTLKPRPKASTTMIRSVVEAADGSVPGYAGHQAQILYDLFPNVCVFDGTNISADEDWRIFFEICVNDCDASESWIDTNLSASLKGFCDCGVTEIPFRMIGRSVLDSDPTSLFMAIYRCLEYLFSYGSMTSIISSLGISVSWSDLLSEIENKTSWRGKEDLSLASLFRSVTPALVTSLAKHLGLNVAGKSDDETAISVASKIYSMRNSIVHYRPTHAGASLTTYNWNRICEGLSAITVEVYENAFP